MSLPHATSGDLINIAPLGDKFEGAVSHAFLKTDHLELMRLVLPAGIGEPSARSYQTRSASVEYTTLPWVIMAPFGKPVVPEV